MCLSLIDWLVQERKLVDCYLLSHEAPPDHKWPAPICCRVCGFTACCDADVRKDAEELGLMSDVKRRQWQAEHEGNVPHQSPVLAIDVCKSATACPPSTTTLKISLITGGSTPYGMRLRLMRRGR